jgi:hypothetical protein
MKKFGNAADKINVILSVFNADERLKIRDIASRVKDKGYNIKDAHLRMFIYYNMIYKHLKKEDINGTNRYSVLN